MLVKTESISSISRRLVVTIPSARVDTQFENRLKRMAKTVKINGFRPGKVPLTKVRAEYGASIHQDVVNDLIQNTVFEALSQEKINAVGVPSIDKVNLTEEGLVYEALVEIYPQVEVAALGKLKLEQKTATIEDADIDKMLEQLRAQRQEFSPKKGAAAKDDQVTINFAGSVDGEAFDGGISKEFKLVLGSGQMIPGFEDGIIGMKASEEKTIDVTFPENYQTENLAGKAAQFVIELITVEKAKLPELNAEFFTAFGVAVETLDEFKTDVRKNMTRELISGLRASNKQTAFDALVEANPNIEIPQAMVKNEIQRQKQQMLRQFSQQFGGAQNIDESLLPDELFQEQSERSVKLGLLVAKIIESNQLVVDPARVDSFIAEIAAAYEDPSDVITMYQNKQQREQIEAVVLEDQVVDFIVDQAKVTKTTTNYEALKAEQTARR